jgi:hypothetical protein
MGVVWSYIERHKICRMNYNFDNNLDGLHDMIQTFDFRNFVNQDTVPPKIQHVLASIFFCKIGRDNIVSSKVMHNNVVSPKYIDIVFQMIDFTIHSDSGVVCCLSTYVDVDIILV